MRIIGVMTGDFQFFYRLVRRLKERGESFTSLDFDGPVPPNVAVVITTPPERDKVPFGLVAACYDPEAAINLAKTMFKGRRFRNVVIGIDPGWTTGMAMVGDGKVLLTDEINCPEEAGSKVKAMLEGVEHDDVLVRIGHGDRTIRNRLIRSIWNLADRVEIVDETSTTRNTSRPNIDAAILISKMMGEELERPLEVAPTPGEVREVQRRSRVESEGRFTISKDLARSVAKGKMKMDEAIQRQQER
jgi:hypothetical protein